MHLSCLGPASCIFYRGVLQRYSSLAWIPFTAHQLTLGCRRAKSLQSCLSLCEPMHCSPPGSSVHGILQAKILEWGAMLSSWRRESSQPRNQTCVSYVSCIGRWILYHQPREGCNCWWLWLSQVPPVGSGAACQHGSEIHIWRAGIVDSYDISCTPVWQEIFHFIRMKCLWYSAELVFKKR